MNYSAILYSVLSFFLFTFLFFTGIGYSQLTDVTQTTPTVPGGQIGKSLDEQIGTGQGDELTPGSSIYIINRDPASNLNPGNPGTNNPQDPSEHGSINLGELFQIESEGPE